MLSPETPQILPCKGMRIFLYPLSLNFVYFLILQCSFITILTFFFLFKLGFLPYVSFLGAFFFFFFFIGNGQLSRKLLSPLQFMKVYRQWAASGFVFHFVLCFQRQDGYITQASLKQMSLPQCLDILSVIICRGELGEHRSSILYSVFFFFDKLDYSQCRQKYQYEKF